jgi:hypothetical protein
MQQQVTAAELDTLIRRFNDDYIQNVAAMSTSRIGGQIRYVLHTMRDPIMSHYNHDLPLKLIDGCILRDANNLFKALNANTKSTVASFFGLEAYQLTPYHLTILVELETRDVMTKTLGLRNYAEYIRSNGLEDLVAFILGIGNRLIKQLP